jgi:hypothetical protein
MSLNCLKRLNHGKKLVLKWLEIDKSLFKFTKKKKKTRAETGLWVSPPGEIYTTLQNRLF